MSVWYKEVVKVDGDLKCYIGIQNDFTGTILYQIRRIYYEGKTGKHYVTADGKRVYIESEYQAELRHQEDIKDALKFYRDQHPYL